MSKYVAAALTKFVTGRVWLVFCDSSCTGFEVTGMKLEDIQAKTKYVRASGATSYGVGLAWAFANDYELDGVAIIGDGGENTTPLFRQAWDTYKSRKNVDLPVFFYQTYVDARWTRDPGGNPQNFERGMGLGSSPVPVTKFDLTHGNVDYYSVANLAQTMNINSFSLVDRIMACPLVKLEQVLPRVIEAGVRVTQ